MMERFAGESPSRGILVTALALSTILFAVVYGRLLQTVPPALASPYTKADIGRRLSAVMVDALIVMSAWVLFRYYESAAYVILGLLYVVLRDSVAGRSVGKFCFGLVVIDLLTGQPCGRIGSAKRNIFFLVPGPNIAAVFLETATIVRDLQGQRLGDRLAHTQVVEGFGVRDFSAAFQRWWRDFLARLERTPGRPRRLPVKVDRRACAQGPVTDRPEAPRPTRQSRSRQSGTVRWSAYRIVEPLRDIGQQPNS